MPIGHARPCHATFANTCVESFLLLNRPTVSRRIAIYHLQGPIEMVSSIIRVSMNSLSIAERAQSSQIVICSYICPAHTTLPGECRSSMKHTLVVDNCKRSTLANQRRMVPDDSPTTVPGINWNQYSDSRDERILSQCVRAAYLVRR